MEPGDAAAGDREEDVSLSTDTLERSDGARQTRSHRAESDRQDDLLSSMLSAARGGVDLAGNELLLGQSDDLEPDTDLDLMERSFMVALRNVRRLRVERENGLGEDPQPRSPASTAAVSSTDTTQEGDLVTVDDGSGSASETDIHGEPLVGGFRPPPRTLTDAHGLQSAVAAPPAYTGAAAAPQRGAAPAWTPPMARHGGGGLAQQAPSGASPLAAIELQRQAVSSQVHVVQQAMQVPKLQSPFTMFDLKRFVEEHSVFVRRLMSQGQKPPSLLDSLETDALVHLTGMVNAHLRSDKSFVKRLPHTLQISDIDRVLSTYIGGQQVLGPVISRIADKLPSLLKSALATDQAPSAQLGYFVGKLDALAAELGLALGTQEDVLSKLSVSPLVNNPARSEFFKALPEDWSADVRQACISSGAQSVSDVFDLAHRRAIDIWDSVWLSSRLAKKKKKSTQEKSGTASSDDTGAKGGEDSSGGGKNKRKKKKFGHSNKSSGAETGTSSSEKGFGKPKRVPVPTPGATCEGCGAQGHEVFKLVDGKRVKNCPKYLPKDLYSKLHRQWESSGRGESRRVQGPHNAVDEHDGMVSVKIFSNSANDAVYAEKTSVKFDRVVVDSGADFSVLPRAVFDNLRGQLGGLVTSEMTARDPRVLRVADSTEHKVELAIELTLGLDMGVAPKESLARVRFLVPTRSYSSEEILLGQDVLRQAGVPPLHEQLQERLAAAPGDVVDLTASDPDALAQVEREASARRVATAAILREEPEPFGRSVGKKFELPPEEDGDADLPPIEGVLGEQRPHARADDPELHAAIADMRERAVQSGFPDSHLPKLDQILQTNVDVFALGFSKDLQSADVPAWQEAWDPVGWQEYKAKSSNSSYRKYSMEEREFMTEFCDDLVSSGKLVPLEEAKLPPDTPRVYSPAVCVRKSTGKLRLVFDLRAANLVTQDVHLATPDVEEVLDHALRQNASMYAQFDLLGSYWQRPLAPESQGLFLCRAQTTRGGEIFVPQFVLQGAKNSASALIRMLDGILRDIESKIGLSRYVDDLLIGSRNIDEHLERIDALLSRLRRHHVYVNPSKVSLFSTSVDFLGYHIENGRKHVLADRKEFILGFPRPRTVERLGAFLGVTGWLRQSLPGYHQLVAPLQELKTRLSASSRSKRAVALKRIVISDDDWTAAHDDAFESTKRALAESVALGVIKDGDEACLYVDSSDQGYAYFLCSVAPNQMDLPHLEREVTPVAYGGRLFKAHELKYSLPRKEALAAKEAVEKQRLRLMRKGLFHLFSDHLNLVRAVKAINSDSLGKVVTGALSRIALFLSAHPGYYWHVSGDENLAADYGSRVAEDLDPSPANVRMVFGQPLTRQDGLEVAVSSDFEMVDDSDSNIHIVDGRAYQYGRGHAPARLDSSSILPSTGARYNLRPRSSRLDPGVGVQHQEQLDDNEVQDDSGSTQLDLDGVEVEKDDVPVKDFSLHRDADVPEHAYNMARAGLFLSGDFAFPSISEIRRSQRKVLEAGSVSRPLRMSTVGLPAHLQQQDEIVVNDDTVLVNGEETSIDEDGLHRLDGRIWIPVSQDQLHMRILVELHSGCLHSSVTRMVADFNRIFVMLNSRKWIKYLVSRCANCLTSRLGDKVPRPMGATMIPERPNALMGMDFVKLFPERSHDVGARRGNDLTPYLLVMLDHFSRFTLLWPAARANAAAAFDGFVFWCQIFGPPSVLMTDRGSHFDSELNALTSQALGVEQAFSTPRWSRSNGRSERRVRDVVEAFRNVCSEARVPHDCYPVLLPYVTFRLNACTSPALGDRSPHEVMFGREPRGALEKLVHRSPDDDMVFLTKEVGVSFEEKVQELKRHLDSMWLSVRESHEGANAEARRRWNAKRHVSPLLLQVGDNVVYRARQKGRVKVTHKWLGPAAVIGVLSGSVFKIRDLLTQDTYEVHASHLARFDEALLGVEQRDLARSAAFQRYSHQIGRLGRVRLGADGRHVVMVHYRGYDNDDETGQAEEALEPLHRAMPKTVEKLLKRLEDDGEIALAQSVRQELHGDE
ncbi:Gag-Pol polyprotein [Cleaved into: Matrix protein p15 (MA) [Durusdinium trenchii]|uniref:Gag-Pol polyprotein [Cleaved into: Matrix protein p15 (MA) n=1 Tax=Durusdinium trenchii TaxID=1381693 RepID=A0ABP0IW58_9DINO